MRKQLNKAVHRLSLTIACLAFAANAFAQTYPARPIRVINPYSPGGTGDVIIRPIAEKLSKALGQPVIIENRPGSFVGVNLVAKAAPDGYTLLLADAGSIAISQALQPKPPYDSVKDFHPITQFVSAPQVLVARPGLPVKTMKELLDYAKANPGKITYGSVGPGSVNHLAGAKMEMMAGVTLLHVPYKGSAPAIADLQGGHIDTFFINIAGALPLIQSGKVRAIAVTTLKRSALLQDVPAVNEVLPGFEVNSWWGVMAPAGTPQDIIARLHAEFVQVLKTSEIADRLKQGGQEIEGSTPEQYAAQVKGDIALWAKVVKGAGLAAN